MNLIEVFFAALYGDITAVQNWLAAPGGDPNEAIEQAISSHGICGFSFEPGSTLLMAAASRKQLDVVGLLVEAGADVNVWAGGWTALIWAVSRGSTDCIEYLLAHGANISGIVDGTRINLSYGSAVNLLYPRIVRMLLVAGESAGVVLTTARFDGNLNNRSLEEIAKERARNLRESSPDLANDCAEAAFILENTRLAGHSYKRWVLKDYMALLRLRSLLARGRARHGPETTVVAARLFGSLNGFADVPKECFWRVVEYAWLGDWRHP